jgi:hypothetical protein
MKTTTTSGASWRFPTWLIGPALIATGAALILGGGPRPTTAPASTAPKVVPVSLATTAPAPPVTVTRVPRTRPIEAIRVGDRVVAGNPEGAADEPSVDSTSTVKLELTLAKPDDIVDVVLLRPRAWADTVGARVGGTVNLDLPELGASGPAMVTAVGPCPPIKDGDGRVVTGTFHHRSVRVLELVLEGQSEAIGVTASHPFWSEDQVRFVPAGELREGERLRTMQGQARVASLRLRAGEHPVYNLEVHSEHVYRVADAGILVHNSGCGKAVVLGEGMGAVKTAAKNLQASGINAKWYQAWGKNFPKGRPMTPAELTAALARNEAWILSKIKQGYKFYDIGLDAARATRSPFYALEQQILKKFGISTIPIPRP